MEAVGGLDRDGAQVLAGREGELVEVAFAGGLVDGGDPEVAVVEVDALGVVGVALQWDGAYQGEVSGVGCGQGSQAKDQGGRDESHD